MRRLRFLSFVIVFVANSWLITAVANGQEAAKPAEPTLSGEVKFITSIVARLTRIAAKPEAKFGEVAKDLPQVLDDAIKAAKEAEVRRENSVEVLLSGIQLGLLKQLPAHGIPLSSSAADLWTTELQGVLDELSLKAGKDIKTWIAGVERAKIAISDVANSVAPKAPEGAKPAIEGGQTPQANQEAKVVPPNSLAGLAATSKFGIVELVAKARKDHDVPTLDQNPIATARALRDMYEGLGAFVDSLTETDPAKLKDQLVASHQARKSEVFKGRNPKIAQEWQKIFVDLQTHLEQAIESKQFVSTKENWKTAFAELKEAFELARKELSGDSEDGAVNTGPRGAGSSGGARTFSQSGAASGHGPWVSSVYHARVMAGIERGHSRRMHRIERINER